ncbi:MAG: hypothetical protein OHK0022_27560 [Roseiflexaceae bacterium]
MVIQQAPQLVSSFELLIDEITPVSIPSSPATRGQGGNGGAHGGPNSGTATAVAPVAAAVAASQPIYTSAGPLSRVIHKIASSAPAQGVRSVTTASTRVTPIAIQGYFLWISNLGSAPLTLTVTVTADRDTSTTLTTAENPSNPLTAKVLAITDVGNLNSMNYLRMVNGVPTLTLPAIPAGGTALFVLVGNYTLFTGQGNSDLTVRGSLSIAIDPSSPAQFAPLLLEPQIRTVFITPGQPTLGETAFALPTARGTTRYTLPGPAFYIRDISSGYVIDAAGPVLLPGFNQVALNPINGSPTQLWYLTSDNYIVNAANNYLLGVPDSRANAGAPVLSLPLSPTADSPKWVLQSNGTLKSSFANVVVGLPNSSAGKITPNTPLELTPGNTALKWTLLPTLS